MSKYLFLQMVPLRPLHAYAPENSRKIYMTRTNFLPLFTRTQINSKNIGSNTRNKLWEVAEKEKDNWGAWFLLKAHVKSNGVCSHL